MDITMCPGEGCPIKKDCHRYTAIPSSWQSMFTTPPFGLDTINTCDHFWDNWNQCKNSNLDLTE